MQFGVAAFRNQNLDFQYFKIYNIITLKNKWNHSELVLFFVCLKYKDFGDEN